MRIEHRAYSSIKSNPDGHIIVSSNYTWAWLTNVARRRDPMVPPRVTFEFGVHPDWLYAPVHVAITQEYL